MPDEPLITDLPEHTRAQAMERFAILRPFLEDGVALTQIATDQQLEVRTLYRWVRRYRAAGLRGLVRQGRGDKGASRLNDDLPLLIEALALRTPPLSAAAIHRQVCTIADQQGWPRPSYATVYATIKRINPGLRTLAHEGTKAYKHVYDLIHRRTATAPNAIWQADHTQLDIWIITEQGEAARPWLTVILDDYSRAIAGYVVSLTAPSAFTTGLALRDAIWRKADSRWHICGIPRIFYTDHGSDFTSKHMEQVSAELKIQLIFSTPDQPRGRGKIERFFQTVNQLFLCEQPGYSPAGTTAQAPRLTLSQLTDRFHQFLIETYHQRVHSETTMAPQVRWDSEGFLPQLPTSLEQLDLLLTTVVKPRKIHADGIHFHGLRYLDLTLTAYVGESVTIRYDPRDMAEIRVYHNDRFLCRAYCQELTNQTISLKDLLQARKQRQRTLETLISQRQALLAHYTAAPTVGEPSPSTTASPPAPPAPAPPAPGRSGLKRYEHDD
jgi:putative transposase